MDTSNGAAHPSSTAYRNKFSGKYDYRLFTGGVGESSTGWSATRPINHAYFIIRENPRR